MKFSRLIALLKYYRQFIPFRLNFVLFLAVLFICLRWLKLSNTESSSYSGLILLMAKLTLIFALAIVTLSFFSSFICFLFFIIQQRKNKNASIELMIDLASYKNNLLRIQTKLPFALKPLLGFVQVRLLYDHHKMTDPYLITNRMKKHFFSFNTGLAGNNALLLPDIKEYYFSDAMISFVDMLQFFSFTAHANVQKSVCNLPHSLLAAADEMLPKKTEDEVIRIEQLRKVEGEMLNYKKFEDSDDVRRIVWKIFAKNKEIVVRVPETMDPFASHLYMYASFFNQQNFLLQSTYHQEMLNYFKNCVWTIYDALNKQAFDVKYISDQAFSHQESQHDPTQFMIALATWHRDKVLMDYIKPKTASVICIHSYTSEHDLKQLLHECDTQTTVFFVQLSKVFKSHYWMNWLLRIFIKAPSDRLTALKSKWALMPLKYQTVQYEKNLYSILKKADIQLEII